MAAEISADKIDKTTNIPKLANTTVGKCFLNFSITNTSEPMIMAHAEQPVANVLH